MSEMVERVARAIVQANGGDPDEIYMGEPLWKNHTDEARAAIEAMREPTKAMVDAGCAALRDVPAAKFMELELSGRLALPRFKMDRRWRAMIDAALKE